MTISPQRRQHAKERFEPMLESWKNTKLERIKSTAAGKRKRRSAQSLASLPADVLEELHQQGFNVRPDGFVDANDVLHEDVPRGEYWGMTVVSDELLQGIEFSLKRLWNAALGRLSSQPRFELDVDVDTPADIREEVRDQRERFRSYTRTPSSKPTKVRTPKYLLVYDPRAPNEITVRIPKQRTATVKLSRFERAVIEDLLGQTAPRALMYHDMARLDGHKPPVGPLPKKLQDTYRQRIKRFSDKCNKKYYGNESERYGPLLESASPGIWELRVVLLTVDEYLSLRKSGRLP